MDAVEIKRLIYSGSPVAYQECHKLLQRYPNDHNAVYLMALCLLMEVDVAADCRRVDLTIDRIKEFTALSVWDWGYPRMANRLYQAIKRVLTILEGKFARAPITAMQ